MEVNRKQVRDAFIKYTDAYDSSDEKIRLKIEHTFKVAEICDLIADDLGLIGDDKEIAWLLGMLHDVGRFEQIKRYQTFNDAISVDHAKFGADLLFQEGLLKEFVPGLLNTKEGELVELAIRQHNAYRICEGLTERELLFCKIIRDADKLDIFRVNVETSMMDLYGVTDEEVHNTVVSDAVMQAFNEEHCILKSLRTSPADHLIGHISLAYELEFPISYKIVEDQGYLKQMLTFESENETAKEQFDYARAHIAEFIRKNS